MNNQEYERGELITDWSTVKQGDRVIDSETDVIYRYICHDKEIDLIILSYPTGIYNGYDPTVNEYYRSIPKKEKVIKYMYEFLDFKGDVITTQNEIKPNKAFYKDDNEFIIYHPFCKSFHRLNWTAQPFDE